MAEAEQKEEKSKKAKSTNVKIYCRVRALMPWEPRKTSVTVHKNSLRNKTVKTNNEYTFQKVYNVDIENDHIFQSAVQPMIDNVLKGFNAVMIAYGQTGSGKTYSMLGKPDLGVEGLLPKMLRVLVETPTVKKVELSAVEAFGHHVARIELFDLYDEDNQTPSWADKKGNTQMDPRAANIVTVKDGTDALQKIEYAHAASHFAPTGKNPESSRGHVCFVAKCVQQDPEVAHAELISYFVMVDCAGSEGDSAFTEDYIKQVDKTTLMARRLEAGCINNGLSQLQIIFNELRQKGVLSNMIGTGMRRILHPYINNRTFMSVLFTLSPSVNNSKSTESTLKFAVTAGMVKVKPVKQEASVNLEKLVQQLRNHIAENDKLIDEQNEKITALQLELEQIRQEGISEGNLPVEEVQAVLDEAAGKAPPGSPVKHGGTHPGPGEGLSENLMKQLADFDAEEEEEDEPLDEMFAATLNDVNQNDIEKEMQEAYQRMQKVAKGTDLVKDVLDVGDEQGQEKTAVAVSQLAATLAAGTMDVTDAAEDIETREEMGIEDVPVDIFALDETELKEHVDVTWVRIDENRAEQENLKVAQKTVVSHLTETNEWLFNSLQEILNS